MTYSTQIQRIKEVINISGLSVTKFANLIGISQTTLNSQIIEKRSLSIDVLNSVLDKFPTLSSEWLLRGKGEMYLNTDVNVNLETYETKPRVPFDAAAGSLTVCSEGATVQHCEQLPVIRAFSNYDFTIIVRGDSMSPEYQSGDEIACLFVHNTPYTQWGRVHVLDTSQGVVLKRIYDNGESVTCKSDNPRYADFSIPKEQIFNMALVIGLVRRY